ncbi:MAG: hypothetical protein BGP21_05215 [Thiobacillus sp. 65-29]|jgi:hypothetical protein|nr:MAG: hypothetical protein BGP21_05215 [Thiobacillus sp. 65-29]
MRANDVSGTNRRLFTRIPFKVDAVLGVGAERHACTLVDISLKGALVERAPPWTLPLGAPCTLSFRLAGDDATIDMAGLVAHVEQSRLGMRCTEIDLDSMTSLRRLVELNLGDEAALHREIHAMLAAGGEG